MCGPHRKKNNILPINPYSFVQMKHIPPPRRTVWTVHPDLDVIYTREPRHPVISSGNWHVVVLVLVRGYMDSRAYSYSIPVMTV